MTAASPRRAGHSRPAAPAGVPGAAGVAPAPRRAAASGAFDQAAGQVRERPVRPRRVQVRVRTRARRLATAPILRRSRATCLRCSGIAGASRIPPSLTSPRQRDRQPTGPWLRTPRYWHWPPRRWRRLPGPAAATDAAKPDRGGLSRRRLAGRARIPGRLQRLRPSPRRTSPGRHGSSAALHPGSTRGPPGRREPERTVGVVTALGYGTAGLSVGQRLASTSIESVTEKGSPTSIPVRCGTS